MPGVAAHQSAYIGVLNHFLGRAVQEATLSLQKYCENASTEVEQKLHVWHLERERLRRGVHIQRVTIERKLNERSMEMDAVEVRSDVIEQILLDIVDISPMINTENPEGEEARELRQFVDTNTRFIKKAQAIIRGLVARTAKAVNQTVERSVFCPPPRRANSVGNHRKGFDSDAGMGAAHFEEEEEYETFEYEEVDDGAGGRQRVEVRKVKRRWVTVAKANPASRTVRVRRTLPPRYVLKPAPVASEDFVDQRFCSSLPPPPVKRPARKAPRVHPPSKASSYATGLSASPLAAEQPARRVSESAGRGREGLDAAPWQRRRIETPPNDGSGSSLCSKGRSTSEASEDDFTATSCNSVLASVSPPLSDSLKDDSSELGEPVSLPESQWGLASMKGTEIDEIIGQFQPDLLLPIVETDQTAPPARVSEGLSLDSLPIAVSVAQSQTALEGEPPISRPPTLSPIVSGGDSAATAADVAPRPSALRSDDAQQPKGDAAMTVPPPKLFRDKSLPQLPVAPFPVKLQIRPWKSEALFIHKVIPSPSAVASEPAAPAPPPIVRMPESHLRRVVFVDRTELVPPTITAPPSAAKIQSKPELRSLAGSLSHRIFIRRDSQGFVIPPPKEHVALVQKQASGSLAKPTDKARKSSRKARSWRANAPEVQLTRSRVAPFHGSPHGSDEWTGWNRFRGEEYLRERRNTGLLTGTSLRKAVSQRS
jgi:hypothetical protein